MRACVPLQSWSLQAERIDGVCSILFVVGRFSQRVSLSFLWLFSKCDRATERSFFKTWYCGVVGLASLAAVAKRIRKAETHTHNTQHTAYPMPSLNRPTNLATKLWFPLSLSGFFVHFFSHSTQPLKKIKKKKESVLLLLVCFIFPQSKVPPTPCVASISLSIYWCITNSSSSSKQLGSWLSSPKLEISCSSTVYLKQTLMMMMMEMCIAELS